MLCLPDQFDSKHAECLSLLGALFIHDFSSDLGGLWYWEPELYRGGLLQLRGLLGGRRPSRLEDQSKDWWVDLAKIMFISVILIIFLHLCQSCGICLLVSVSCISHIHALQSRIRSDIDQIRIQPLRTNRIRIHAFLDRIQTLLSWKFSIYL